MTLSEPHNFLILISYWFLVLMTKVNDLSIECNLRRIKVFANFAIRLATRVQVAE